MKLLALSAVALGALAPAACSDEATGVTTIRFWAMGREAEVVGALLPEFERTHPGIRVEVQQVPWTVAHEKLLTAFVGESTPDIAQLGNTWVAEFAALDALLPLDAEVARSASVAPPDYFPGIWDINEVDGALYGIPWYVDTRLVFYRSDLLAAAGFSSVPVTWPAWLDAMRAVKARVGPDRYAILIPLNEHEQLLSFALQQGTSLVRDGGRWGDFRSAGFRRALTFYLQIFVEGLAPIATETQVSNPWDELGRGYFTFLIHGPWSIGEFKRRLTAAQQATWATAPLPGPAGPDASIASGSSLVIFRRARNPAAAWQLIEYLSQPAVQRRFYDLIGNLPPRRSSWDDARFTGDRHVAAFRDQLERAVRTPPIAEWERIITEMRTVSERAARTVRRSTTPAELAAIVDATAAELDQRVDRILEKRRWILERRR